MCWNTNNFFTFRTNHIIILVFPMRLERITPTLEEWCSIQLSYGNIFGKDKKKEEISYQFFLFLLKILSGFTLANEKYKIKQDRDNR